MPSTDDSRPFAPLNIAVLTISDSRTEEMRNGASVSLGDGSVSTSGLGENFPLRDFPITDMRETGAFVFDELSRGPLSLIAALRYDHNELSPESDVRSPFNAILACRLLLSSSPR